MYTPVYEKPRAFYDRFERKPGDELITHYCPGCGHGLLHKYIAEALVDFGIQDRTVLVSPVGCSVFAYYYFDVGNVQAAHGRAPAVATGIKRSLPESIVISYQGDGDLGAIGGNEILHAANRGENITVFFVNNAIYGMTGGQMAPTTLIGQKTTTTPFGRKLETEGYPLRVSELLSSLDAPVYIERVALIDNKTNMKARAAVRKAIKNQIEGRGFSLVEVLSPCPTGWNMTPPDAVRWIKEYMLPWFPLKVFKDEAANRQAASSLRSEVSIDLVPEILGLIEEREPTKGPSVLTTVKGLERRYANPRIKIAGFGGQGLLFLGRVMAESGMRQGYNVSWLPSYGPEMRGGTANCQVTISSDPISSPLVSRPTVLVAMNRPSLERFEGELVSDGLLVYDSSMIEVEPSRDDIEAIALPATRIADQLGSAKAANMVMLGFYLEKTTVLDKNVVLRTLRALTKKESLVELNLKAIEAGIDCA